MDGELLTASEIAARLAAKSNAAVGELDLAEPTAALAFAADLIEDVIDLAAVSAYTARQDGVEWAVIAEAARLRTDTARYRWGNDKAAKRARGYLKRRRLAAPAPVDGEPPAGSAMSSRPTDRSQRQLCAALSQMRIRSGCRLAEIAEATGRHKSSISRLLRGGRLPTWETCVAIARACGADPEDLRHLWLAANGVVPDPILGHEEAALAGARTALVHALNGLRLAAGEPDYATIAGLAKGEKVDPGDAPAHWLAYDPVEAIEAGDLDLAVFEMAGGVEGIRRVFEPNMASDWIPPWKLLAVIVTALDGDPKVIKPLWKQLKFTRDGSWSQAEPHTWTRWGTPGRQTW
ncbi:hypothetical protein BIV57_18150 [Mangrovactinospora gilvigrisea]|uniref:HTH cro/C1-type domain-containing protein n=1 Tax=Mangrovactinospora gilvigrisea TaxID=1428644 RepID=A0A1J7C8Y5_9ACTN|nr:helix-turn-helix transcriptional regulator [Mangrovactinospora gilvigrisea]OIV36082.1 hypothetical protein BIV57_18150 [Mangrovactinospora gilvigrisea]